MASKIYIDRPPRIEPELPSGVYDIPNPPDTEEKPGEALAQAFLPMVMIFGYILVSVLGGGQGRNMFMMIPMALSVVASVVVAMYARAQDKKLREEMAEAYKRRISELRREMESKQEQQRIYYYHNYPNPETTLAIAQDIGKALENREEEIRSGTRLWERRPSDHDFLHLRLGISSRTSTVLYNISEDEKTENPLTREAVRLAQDSKILLDVPVTIPLHLAGEEAEKGPESREPDQPGADRESKPQSVRHSIGITGSNPEKIYCYLRNMLVDYAAFHSPMDTMLYVAGTAPARQHWRWAYALPHCKEADKTETLVFEETEKPPENEADRMRLYWKNIRTILERRRMRLSDKESGEDVKLPFMVVVVDVLEPAPEWSCLKDLEAEAAISTILMDGQMLGAAVIFLVPDRSKIPSRAMAVIEVDEKTGDANSAVFRYAETGFNTIRYVGYTSLVTTQEAARGFSRQLEPLDIRRGYGSSLAATVTLLEMLNLTSIDEMQQFARENWQRSMDPKQSDWLNTAVGLLSGNEPRILTFSAKADGVHGLIAGSTGSGKSELLMTLIIGLALNFDPRVLNFVLIDYKGGAAFEPFKRLPHKVDIVTNLDQSATARVFASVIAELDRRQKLNTYTNSKDIVHYRRKGLLLEPERPPYPHLFIIIDEFAEMIAGNAEYKAQLESITRLGRALGVTLILAAQRPVGVTDQMRANIKFRICLRVETPDDSRELLRRSDAAFLPPGIPGRGYLQVGNENIELIQTAYTGGDYKGPQEENVVPNVIWVDRPKKTSGQKAAEPPKLYDVIVEMLDSLARTDSKPQWRPWPEFLPNQVRPRVLSLETPLDMAYMNDADIDTLRLYNLETVEGMTLNELAIGFWHDDYHWGHLRWGSNAMRPLVGVVDNPYQASQKPLLINFPSGHAVVFGASGRGKTTFLRTTIATLALLHSPDELHIYILDFGGRALTVLRDLPHIGAIITSEEEERVMRVLRKINDIIDHRQLLFSDARVNNLDSYNQNNPTKQLPAVLVVIDNFAEFKEYYENLMSPLISLVRESRAYGVHFLFSADVPAALTGKLFNLITERVTLKLSDPSEYSSIVGRGVPADLSAVPGRGYVRVGNMPLEFQTALAFAPDDSDPDGLVKLGQMATRMVQLWNNGWKGERPSPIETLPIRVTLEKLIQESGEPPAKRITGLLGIDDRSLQPAWLDIERQGPHMVVIGQPFSGKSTTLRTILLTVTYHFSPDEVMVILVDFARKLWKGGNRSLLELPHVVQGIEEIDQLDDLLENMTIECADFDANPRRRKILILVDNYDGFVDEAGRKKMTFFEGFAGLVRKYQTAGVSVILAGSVGITSSPDDIRKVVMSTNFGIALKSADAVNRLNGKFPRSLADVELPMGRAFTIRSGITSMLQLATPYANDEDIEGALDAWVNQIIQRHGGKKVGWLSSGGDGGEPPASAEGTRSSAKAKEKPKDEVNTATPPQPIAKPPDKGSKKLEEKYDIASLKNQLIEMGLPASMVQIFSSRDIVENARAFGLIKDEPEA